MNEKDISEETKKQIERRCGSDRRNTAHLDPNLKYRRTFDRRGRKSAEDLAKYIWNEVLSEMSWEEMKEKLPMAYKTRIEDAEKYLKFLGY